MVLECRRKQSSTLSKMVGRDLSSEKRTCWSGCGPKTAQLPCPEWCTGRVAPVSSPRSSGTAMLRESSCRPQVFWEHLGNLLCSFASRALFPGNTLSFKVLRIWEEVMEYMFFWGKVMCKSSNNSLQDGDKQNKKPGKKAPCEFSSIIML